MAWKATYGGRDYGKKSGKTDFPGQKGNKGIPPEMGGIGKANTSKGVDFPGHKGDKGLSYVKGKGGNSGSPLD